MVTFKAAGEMAPVTASSSALEGRSDSRDRRRVVSVATSSPAAAPASLAHRKAGEGARPPPPVSQLLLLLRLHPCSSKHRVPFHTVQKVAWMLNPLSHTSTLAFASVIACRQDQHLSRVRAWTVRSAVLKCKIKDVCMCNHVPSQLFALGNSVPW